MADPRNVRNCNPGNIRVGAMWKGLRPAMMMTPEQEMERSFCVFLDPHWGFRALALTLRSYEFHDGVHTLAQAIYRWAPPGDNNNTEAYLAAVSHDTGIGRLDTLDLNNQDQLCKLAQAITVHETGSPFVEYWRTADLSAGVAAAFA